jgi:broad specificity polyphosphatase/5'/3'-nucleotidase SurE
VRQYGSKTECAWFCESLDTGAASGARFGVSGGHNVGDLPWLEIATLVAAVGTLLSGIAALKASGAQEAAETAKTAAQTTRAVVETTRTELKAAIAAINVNLGDYEQQHRSACRDGGLNEY